MAKNLTVLPDNPAELPTTTIVSACQEVFARRDELVGTLDVDGAQEALRRALAIEKYVSTKEHKGDARRAARILETAVGEALGPPTQTHPGKNASHVSEALSKDDRSRFRLMAEHRANWWPQLDEKALSRRHVLTIIDEIRRPKSNGAGVARIECADAVSWLKKVEQADLLLTDPPYSTDVEDIWEFVKWFPFALSKLKPTGRAFVFIGAYADELAAYFSTALPDGWCWCTPHAWVYRNTIGPTPQHDFVRNWQCVLSARGPEADKLHSARITELFAGFVENAPDGRHEVKHHKWQKPLGAIQRIIRIVTNPGDVVIDPFAGSGTTLLAAKDEGRYGIGCDVYEEWVELAIARGCDAG